MKKSLLISILILLNCKIAFSIDQNKVAKVGFLSGVGITLHSLSLIFSDKEIVRQIGRSSSLKDLQNKLKKESSMQISSLNQKIRNQLIIGPKKIHLLYLLFGLGLTSTSYYMSK